MRLDMKDFLPGLCGVGFGAWLLRETYFLDLMLSYRIGGGMSAAGYPRVLGLAIIGLSILLLLRAVTRGLAKRVGAGDGVLVKDRWAYKKVVSIFLGLVIYTLLLYPVGYFIMTTLILALVMILVGERRWVFIVATSISLTFALYGISFYIFHIDLPGGVLRYLMG